MLWWFAGAAIPAEVALVVTGSAQIKGWHRSQGGLEHWRDLALLLHPAISL